MNIPLEPLWELAAAGWLDASPVMAIYNAENSLIEEVIWVAAVGGEWKRTKFWKKNNETSEST